jgi:hypothetical protein
MLSKWLPAKARDIVFGANGAASPTGEDNRCCLVLVCVFLSTPCMQQVDCGDWLFAGAVMTGGHVPPRVCCPGCLNLRACFSDCSPDTP